MFKKKKRNIPPRLCSCDTSTLSFDKPFNPSSCQSETIYHRQCMRYNIICIFMYMQNFKKRKIANIFNFSRKCLIISIYIRQFIKLIFNFIFQAIIQYRNVTVIFFCYYYYLIKLINHYS